MFIEPPENTFLRKSKLLAAACQRTVIDHYIAELGPPGGRKIHWGHCWSQLQVCEVLVLIDDHLVLFGMGRHAATELDDLA